MQAARWTGFWAVSVAIVLFVTTLAALPSFGTGAVPIGPNPPLGVHLSYLDDPTSAIITWQTAAAATSRAEWGRSLGPPYASFASGTDYTSPGGLYLHDVTLTGLTPGAKYYYRVGDEAMSSSFGQGSFRAAPAKGSSDTFTFAAAGDWGNTTQTAATSNAIARRDPNFVLPLGDLYYAHDDATVGGVYQKWMTFGRGSFVQSAVGNHEVDEPGGQNTPTLIHCAFSNLPGNERTYSFTWGNAFFLTEDWGGSTSSQLDGVDGTPQDCTGVAGTPAIRTWVDAELAAANADPTIRWIIVYHHFPCYDTTTVGFPLLCPTDGGHDQIEDILINRHVDLVLAGHDHTYGRTHPVHSGITAQTGNAYDTPGAPMYFILGTGGASGRATCRNATWIAHCDNMTTQRGYGWFQITPTMIRYEFVENALGVIDSFTLKKSPAVGFAVSADPSTVHIGPGQAVSTNVSVLGASSDAVTLSSSDCPPAATCGFSPASGSPPFMSTLTVTTGSSTPESIYRIDVTASNASASTTAPLDVTVATQVTRTYQQGDGGLYSDTDDAYIYNGSMNENFGSRTGLFIDAQGCVVSSSQFGCKSLIKFPQLIGPNDGQIPPGARIISATLRMRITNSGVTEDLYQELENWDEATVTWNSFATPGFPMKADPVFTFKPNVTGLFSIDVTYVVQNWAVGDPNVGFFLTSTSGDGVIYDSSEASIAANRPKLIVTFEQGPSLTNPVLSYDMETLTANGKMEDLSGNGRHGTITGATDVAGKVGRARNFDGSGDRITTSPISVPGTDFTVAAWFRWTTNPSPYYSGIHGGGGSWELRVMADGRFGATFYQSIGPDVFTDIVSPLAYNDGEWHHAGTVLRSGLVRLYVDGTLVAQDTTNPISSVRTSTQTVVGQVASDFLGDIDEVLVYSRALTDAEIAAIVPPPPAEDPVMQYDMATLLPDGRLKDVSGHVNHGTFVGTTDIPGKVGRARHFGGSGDRIIAPGISVPGTDFTVAAWFRWTTNPSPYYSGIHGGGGSWELRVMADGRFGATFYQSIGPDVFTDIVSPLAYNDGEWHHAAAVLRAGLVELYVDGALVAQDTTNPISSVRTSTQTVVGQVASDFLGDIDEVRVYIRALATGEIAALVPPPPPAADGLVVSYDMETLAPSGRMGDLSGQGHDGSITGTTDVAGKVGRARNFDGSGDRITTSPISVPGTDFTVAAWFRWTTNPSPYYSGIHGGGGSWELRVMADGRFGATFYQSIGPDVFTDIVSPLAYNDGEWHHAAGVLRNGLAEIYVDGVLTASDGTDPISSVRPATGIQIGLVASYFAGGVDEVRVYERALNDTEIANLASTSAMSVPPDPALTVALGGITPSSFILSGFSPAAPTKRLDFTDVFLACVEDNRVLWRVPALGRHSLDGSPGTRPQTNATIRNSELSGIPEALLPGPPFP